MSKTSRRALARYAVEQLIAGKKPARLAKELSASLAESGRSGQYQFLLSDIAWELENRQLLASGQVTSAHKLTTKVINELKDQLKKATGAKEILLDTHIDETVLGGFRLETAG